MIAPNTRDNLTADCGAVNYNGRRHFTIKWCGDELHRDVLDPDANFHRAQCAQAVFRKLEKRFSVGDVAQEQLVEMFGDDADQPDLTWVGDLLIAAANAVEEAEVEGRRPSPIGIVTLSAEHPRLAPYVIDGILRRGETMNIIAPPKIGKSWLGYQILLSIATGRYLFDSHPCRSGKVLLIDNELHPAVIASRIKTSAEAMGIQREEYADSLDILSLRGRLLDLNGIATALEGIEPGTYEFILLDAFYRCFAAGVSENDNSAVAGMYNLIDQIVGRQECGWGNVHHSSKGSQADKSVVDVGAGAGSQSRAADSHLVLREHEERGVVVLDAVVRSFAPIEPLALRWNFPLWTRDDGIDPKAIKGRLSRNEQKASDKDQQSTALAIEALKGGDALTENELYPLCECGKARIKIIIARLEKSGRLGKRQTIRGRNKCNEYFLVQVGAESGGLAGGPAVQPSEPGDEDQEGRGGLLRSPQTACKPSSQNPSPPDKSKGKKKAPKTTLKVHTDDDHQPGDEG